MHQRIVSVASILVAIISIQCGAALAKQLFPLVGAAGASALRLVFASAILLLIWRPWQHPITPSERRAVLLYGASLGAMNLLFYLALDHIPLGLAVAFEFSGPLAIALFKSRRPIDFLWVACAVSGLALLLPLGRESGSVSHLGIIYALGAGVCWALYIVFGQAAGTTMHGGRAVSLGMLVAALLVLPAGAFSAGRHLLSVEVVWTVLGVAILSSALPYSLEMYALKQIPAHTFGVLMSIEPAIAALSGFVFLKERLSSLQWLAIGLVMVASIGCTLSAGEPEPASELIP